MVSLKKPIKQTKSNTTHKNSDAPPLFIWGFLWCSEISLQHITHPLPCPPIPKPRTKPKMEWRISGLHLLVHLWVLNLQTSCISVLMAAEIPSKTRVMLFLLLAVRWERGSRVLSASQEERPGNNWLHRIGALIWQNKRRNTDSEQVTFKHRGLCQSLLFASVLVDFPVAYNVEQILSLERSSAFWSFRAPLLCWGGWGCPATKRGVQHRMDLSSLAPKHATLF